MGIKTATKNKILLQLDDFRDSSIPYLIITPFDLNNLSKYRSKHESHYNDPKYTLTEEGHIQIKTYDPKTSLALEYTLARMYNQNVAYTYNRQESKVISEVIQELIKEGVISRVEEIPIKEHQFDQNPETFNTSIINFYISERAEEIYSYQQIGIFEILSKKKNSEAYKKICDKSIEYNEFELCPNGKLYYLGKEVASFAPSSDQYKLMYVIFSAIEDYPSRTIPMNKVSELMTLHNARHSNNLADTRDSINGKILDTPYSITVRKVRGYVGFIRKSTPV